MIAWACDCPAFMPERFHQIRDWRRSAPSNHSCIQVRCRTGPANRVMQRHSSLRPGTTTLVILPETFLAKRDPEPWSPDTRKSGRRLPRRRSALRIQFPQFRRSGGTRAGSACGA
ncbi:MAG: hypothetical protein AVDCRST_MAG87-1868 [uncultured Thermomicrobiales bacterium]|uniref:Uncharacterized protein n=1 Tax=uncultured Thermomicrobiales bacterium TaxID=1645740 RepID=A0A6J4V1V8_9BACT|nr:MAG: hypothetical protein AVDCRST_MAG87-1868 [uncultured Thermomicrobiales bacterium]